MRAVEAACSAVFSGMMGKSITVKVTGYKGCARRKPSDFLKLYCGFDTDASVEATIDGQKVVMEGLSQKVIPDAVLNKNKDLLGVIPLAAVPVTELQLSGHTIINVIVPAAVAAAMGKLSPKDAAREALAGAYVSSAIPGGKQRAEEVAKRAVRMVTEL